MVVDVIDRRTQLIVGESWWAGKQVSDFGVVAQNSRTRRVDQGLNKSNIAQEERYDNLEDARSSDFQPRTRPLLGTRTIGR